MRDRSLSARAPDLLGPLVALAALVVFLAHGFEGILTRDLAVYAYGAGQAADGVPPYVSILNRAGPLGHLVPALGARAAGAVGVDELLGMRLVMMLVSVASVWVLYLLGRDLLRSRAAGVVAAASLLTCQGFVVYATGGPREKTTMLLFLICCLWSVTRRRWTWAGCFLALATLAWQPVFFVGAAAILVGALAPRVRATFRSLASVALGGAIPTLVCVLGFAMVGAVEELFEGFLFVNAQYTTQAGFLHYLRHGGGVPRLFHGFGPSLWLILGGLIALALAAVGRAPRALRQREPRDVALLAIGAAGLAGVLWSLRAFNGWPDTMVVLPMAALGVGVASRVALDRAPTRVGPPLVAACAALLLVAAVASSVDTREHRLEKQRLSVSRILAAAPEDATIMSVGAPQALVLTGRTNPTRHQMFRAGLAAYVNDSYPGGVAGLVELIDRDRPTFLTLDSHCPRWLRETLSRDYTFAARAPGWTWYIRLDTGRETIRQIRAAGRLARRNGTPTVATGAD